MNLILCISFIIIVSLISYYIAKKNIKYKYCNYYILINVFLLILSIYSISYMIYGLILIPITIGIILSCLSIINKYDKFKCNMLIVIITLVLIVSIGIISYLTTYTYTSTTYTSTIDDIFYDNTSHKDLLEKTCYETEESLFFTEYTIKDQVNNDINLYNSSWILKLYQLFKYELPIKYTELLNQYTIECINKIDNYDLYELYNLSILSKNTSNEKLSDILSEKIQIIYKNQIFNLYLDDSFGYVTQTKIFLDICSNLLTLDDSMISTILEIKQLNLNLINNETVFNYKKEDFKENIFLGGILVNNNILLSEQLTNQQKKIYNSEYVIFWYNELVEYINSLKSIDIIALSGLDAFKNLIDIYKLDTELIDKKIFIEGFDIKEAIYSDLQTYFLLEQSKNILSINSSLNSEIKYDIKYWLYNTYPAISNIESMYYGIRLSNIMDFEINKKKYLNFLNKLSMNDKTITGYYYFDLIFKELNLKANIKNELISLFKDVSLEKFKSFSYEKQYMTLYLDKIYSLNFKSSYNSEIFSLYSNIEKESLQEKDFYYVIKILDLLNLNKDDESFLKIINDYYLDIDYNSIYQIYRVIDLVSVYKFDINYSEINDYLNKSESNTGGYFISAEDKDLNSITLRSFYEGIIIKMFLIDSTK